MAKLTADVEALAEISPQHRKTELADVHEQAARLLLDEVKQGKGQTIVLDAVQFLFTVLIPAMDDRFRIHTSDFADRMPPCPLRSDW